MGRLAGGVGAVFVRGASAGDAAGRAHASGIRPDGFQPSRFWKFRWVVFVMPLVFATMNLSALVKSSSMRAVGLSSM